MTDKILFVDDDPNILNAYKRQLRKEFNLTTALSGDEGLETIEQEGPFSIVVADMRMPQMDGIVFLTKVQQIAPDTIRVMLTGNADQKTAIDAVNKGNVFRFLTKPTNSDMLVNTLQAAQQQYQLINAERVLLEGTLNGSINLLLDILAMTSPEVMSRDISLQQIATEVASALKVSQTWEMKIATMLSHIAYVTLPTETLTKFRSGESLSASEQEIISHIPETGYKLLVNIPRLEKVATIILYQEKNFDGSGVPENTVSGEDIPIESRILKALYDLREIEEKEDMSAGDALKRMLETSGRYDRRVLLTLIWFFSNEGETANMFLPTEVNVSGLRSGQVLSANLETVDGQLLYAAGHVLSDAMVERLITHHQIRQINEPILVSNPVT